MMTAPFSMLVLLANSLLTAAAPVNVLPYPLAQVGLTEATAGEIERSLVADLQTRPGVNVPGGRQATLNLAELVGDELANCRAELTCLGGLALASDAAYLLTLSVEVNGPFWEIIARLHAAESGAIEAEVHRSLDGEPYAKAEQVRLTVASLVNRFSPASDGRLHINLEESGVTLTLDGKDAGIANDSAFPVRAGAHVVVLTKEGFFPYSLALEIPANGQVSIDASVKPTPQWLESYGLVAWSNAIAASALAGTGAAAVLAAIVVGAGSGVLVLVTQQQVAAHNADPARTAEGRDQLALQTTLAYVGYGISGVAGVLAVLMLAGGATWLIFTPNPFRYDE